MQPDPETSKLVERPIAYESHTLQPYERRMATNEKEAYACVWAVEKLEHFLDGKFFTLHTDHQALTTMLTEPKDQRKSSKFARWLEHLSFFDYKVEYKPGQLNMMADALS